LSVENVDVAENVENAKNIDVAENVENDEKC
jgi:hypothetical protein